MDEFVLSRPELLRFLLHLVFQLLRPVLQLPVGRLQVVEHIVKRSGNHPHIIQLVFLHLQACTGISVGYLDTCSTQFIQWFLDFLSCEDKQEGDEDARHQQSQQEKLRG